MLAFISPIAIKKLILNIFMTNLSVVMNAQAQDSLALKKEERIPGKMHKVEEHDIKYLQTETIRFYTHNEVVNPKNGLLIIGSNACGTKGRLKVSRRSLKFEKGSKYTINSIEFQCMECIKPGTTISQMPDLPPILRRERTRIKQGETKTVFPGGKSSKGS